MLKERDARRISLLLSGGRGEGWSEKGKKEPGSVNRGGEARSITKRGCDHFGEEKGERGGAAH